MKTIKKSIRKKNGVYKKKNVKDNVVIIELIGGDVFVVRKPFGIDVIVLDFDNELI